MTHGITGKFTAKTSTNNNINISKNQRVNSWKMNMYGNKYETKIEQSFDQFHKLLKENLEFKLVLEKQFDIVLGFILKEAFELVKCKHGIDIGSGLQQMIIGFCDSCPCVLNGEALHEFAEIVYYDTEQHTDDDYYIEYLTCSQSSLFDQIWVCFDRKMKQIMDKKGLEVFGNGIREYHSTMFGLLAYAIEAMGVEVADE